MIADNNTEPCLPPLLRSSIPTLPLAPFNAKEWTKLPFATRGFLRYRIPLKQFEVFPPPLAPCDCRFDISLLQMENNEVFEAEAALEARSRSYGSRRRGNGVVKATANGGIGSRKESDFDETPLLSREVDHDYGSSTEASDDGDTRGPPAWSGERDFEGRLWWNKPSVSPSIPTLMDSR